MNGSTDREAVVRTSALLWLLMLILWVVQVRWPQLGFSHSGAVASAGLAGLLLLACAWRGTACGPKPGRGKPLLSHHPAAWAGSAFVFYICVRWWAAGAPAVGNEEFGTLVQCGAWCGAAFFVMKSMDVAGRQQLIGWLVRVIALVALACSVHAVVQYGWLYDRSLAALKESLAGVTPTPLQAGLLHHFQLKRVASVWGDPNVLAGYCAISLVGCWHLVRHAGAGRMRGFDRALGIAAGVGALVAIVLSGSRGGMIEAVMVGCVAAGSLLLGRVKGARGAGGAMAAGLLLIVLIPSRDGIAQGGVEAGQAGPSAWTWRSNTIQERANYITVGVRMFRDAPVVGKGLGGVDLYFGRYKPATARESKYLHNWVIQLLAETGMVGVSLAFAFLGTLAWQCRRAGVARDGAALCVMGMAVLFVLDAMVQLSFNHREMMAMFGMLCGTLMGWCSPCESIAGAGTRGGALGCTGVPRWIVSIWISACIVVFIVPALKGHAYRQDAQEALESGDVADAQQLLRSAEKWQPRNPAIGMQQSVIEEQAGRWSNARLLLENSIRLQPESAAAHAALSGVLQRMGELPRAEQELKLALVRYPANAGYNGQMSQLMLASGRRDDAVEYARRAAEFSPGVPGAEHWPAFYRRLLGEAKQ